MYLEYYSLDRPPFRITPDPSLFFTGGANGRGVVLEALLYAIQSGEGILKVVGEVGSGKTMLCRMLEQRLPNTVEVVYLANPKLTPHDILYAVAFELKLDVVQETPRLVLMQKLQTYLLEQHAANRSVLVIIEEAQSMPLETLEEIRLFSNLETHQHKLMQIILFGQPELDKNLQDKNIRQLRERITHSFHLNPLTPAEVSDYLRHRLQAAGCPAPQVFSKSAELLIAKASDGLTRRINILADKAMLAAYSESATSTRPRSLDNQLLPTVTAQHVKAAIKDSEYQTPRRISPWVATVISLLTVIAVLAWQLAIQHRNEPAQAEEIAAATVLSSTALTSTAPSSTPASFTALASLPAQAVIPVVEAAEEVENLVQAVVADVPEPPILPVAETSINNDTEQSVPVEVMEAAPVETSAETPVATDDEYPEILSERINAFANTRASGNTSGYTLQLLSTSVSEAPFVTRTLNQMHRSGLLDETYVCLTETSEGMLWRVMYGLFPNLETARASIGQLPDSIRTNQPFVQNLSRLQCISARS